MYDKRKILKNPENNEIIINAIEKKIINSFTVEILNISFIYKKIILFESRI
jgi:hypothetical protein